MEFIELEGGLGVVDGEGIGYCVGLQRERIVFCK